MGCPTFATSRSSGTGKLVIVTVYLFIYLFVCLFVFLFIYKRWSMIRVRVMLMYFANVWS